MKPLPPHLRISVVALIASALSWPLIGCGSGGTIPGTTITGTAPTTGTNFSGKVFAGTQPIAGAAVQIYAAGATGTASAATPLLSSALSTDSAGAFSIPAGYRCPAASSQLYVVARGGKIAAAPTSSAIALFTAIGTCGQLVASTQFVINEVTTAAGAWALSQFISPGAQINATATNAKGLSNAVATLGSLANLTVGVAPGAAFPAIGSNPAARINTLANLLNTCTAATAASSSCGKLFAATAISGSAAPTDTLDAVINLIHHPAANVAALYAQATASTAFSPALATAPADWTLFVSFTDGVMNYPTALAVDSTGSVWVASYFKAASKFSPLGQPIFPKGITGNNLSDSYGLAVDANDNVWISNEPESPLPGNTITVLNSSGQSVSGTTGFTNGGLNYPVGIAIDTNATAWVIDYGNAHVTLLSSSGSPLSGASGYTAPSLAFPVAIAIDANHNGWIGDQNDFNITRISADGKTVVPVTCCNGPNSLAIDQRGNVWVGNYYGDSVSELASDGRIISQGGFSANGTITHPQGIAIDGSGNVWIGNFRAAYLTELAGASSAAPGQPLSPAPGFAPDANLFGTFAVAIDASGNIWVTNSNSNTLTEFVGLATPVQTPLLGPPRTP